MGQGRPVETEADPLAAIFADQPEEPSQPNSTTCPIQLVPPFENDHGAESAVRLIRAGFRLARRSLMLPRFQP